MYSDRKHKKSVQYYLLLFLVLELLFGVMLLAVEQHTSQIFYENRAKHLKAIHDVAISRFEAVAHLGAHTTVQQTDLLDLMKQAATADQAERGQIRSVLKADLQGVYNLLLKEAPMMMQLVLPDGTSLLRMHRPEQWGDQLFLQRKILKRSLERGVEQFDYEAGPYSFGAYRFLFPLKSNGNVLGVVEFSLEHQSLISFLNSKQLENNWFMLINNQDLLQQPQEKYGQLAEITLADYKIILPVGQTQIPADIAEYLSRLQDSNALAPRLSSGQIFSLPLGSLRGVPAAATFWPIKDSSGQLMAYSMVLGTTPVLKQLERINVVVFPLGTGLLLAVILLLYKQSLSRQELLEERETLSAITQGMGEGLIVQNREGKLLYLNKEAEQLLGYTVADFEGDTVHDKLQKHVKNSPKDCRPLQAAISGESYINPHAEYTTADGSLLPVAIKATPLIKSGETTGAVMLFSDIRQQLAAERQVKVTNQLYAALSEVNHAIVEASSREWLYKEICRIAVDTAGFTTAYIYQFSENSSLKLIAAHSESILADQDDTEIDLESETSCSFAAMHIQKQSCVNCGCCLVDQLKQNRQVVIDHNNLLTAAYPLICDGQVVAVITFSDNDPSSFGDQQKELLNEIVRDVSFALDNLLRQEEHQNAIDALHRISNFDALTGLPNRSLFIDRLEQAIRNAQKGNETIALALVGINRFKEINNSLGHGIGDIVLREVARRLKELLPEKYTLARPGGDEFLLLMPELGINETAHLISSLLAAVSMQPITIPGQSLAVSVRAGIAIWPDDASEAELLLKNVYAALERTDFAEDNGYQFFSADMTVSSLERILLENDLRTALNQQQFTVCYQPKVRGCNNEIIGCEALVRWNHPEKGMIGPDRFIPLLEELGLIGQLGEWILHEACQQVIKWDAAGLSGLNMAVNLSPVQIKNPELITVVKQAVTQAKLPADRLELEITESAAMHDAEQTIAMLRQLREVGVRIAIDDFGTGYSSLAQLKRLAADTLKIDRSFIMELPDNKEDLAITEAILSLAATLGMEVVAEGVETAEQVEFLNQKNCTLLQGYFYSKPLPADQFEQFVNNRNKDGGF